MKHWSDPVYNNNNYYDVIIYLIRNCSTAYVLKRSSELVFQFHHHPAFCDHVIGIRVCYIIEYAIKEIGTPPHAIQQDRPAVVVPPTGVTTAHCAVPTCTVVVIRIPGTEIHPIVDPFSTRRSNIHDVTIVTGISAHVDRIISCLAVQIEIVVYVGEPLVSRSQSRDSDFESQLVMTATGQLIDVLQTHPEILIVAPESGFVGCPVSDWNLWIHWLFVEGRSNYSQTEPFGELLGSLESWCWWLEYERNNLKWRTHVHDYCYYSLDIF